VLLLELLKALAGRSMTLEELSYSSGGRAESVAAAVEALEAEGLVSVTVRERGVVYGATPAGLEALAAHGYRGATDDGSVAVMFTDLVSSSLLIESLGEQRAHLVRRRHFALLRESIAAHRGHEVKSLGDGLMVVFDEPVRALLCAKALQRAMARERGGLQLRVGLDVGEPVRDGDDYFGVPVIVARRLCDAAVGGEILISGRLHELVGQPVGDGLQPRGSLALKGVSRPVAASAVVV
jgi:class 3 adenylate cyclase